MNVRFALVLVTLAALFAVFAPAAPASAQTYYGAAAAAAPNGGILPQLGEPAAGAVPSTLPDPGQLFTQLASQAASIRTYVSTFATDLFFGLVTLDVAWTIVSALLSGRGDLGDLFVQITQKTITFSLVYWIFVVNGFGITAAIIGSFTQIGTGTLSTIAGGAPTDPVSLIQQGFTNAAPALAEAVAFGLVPDEFFATGFSNLLTGVIDLQVVTVIVTVGAYAFLAGTLALAIVEAYIVTAAGVIVTGFLGSRWTVGIGEKYFSYAVSVGVKLMMVYVCVGVIYPLNGLIQEFNAIPLVGGFVALIAAVIAYSAPQFAASIISGSSNSSFGQFAGQFAGLAGAGLKAAGGLVSGAGTAATLAGAGGGANSGAGAAGAKYAFSDGDAAAPAASENVAPAPQTALGDANFAADATAGARPRSGAISGGQFAAPAALRNGSGNLRAATSAAAPAVRSSENALANRAAGEVAGSVPAASATILSAANDNAAAPQRPALRTSVAASANSATPLASSEPATPLASSEPAMSLASSEPAMSLASSGSATPLAQPAMALAAESSGPANPYETDAEAYRSMSAGQLRSSVTPDTIPKMTRAQLKHAVANENFAQLPLQTKLAAAATLSESNPAQHFAQSALTTAAAFTEGIAKSIPLEDHGSTGAVSIRVNV